ncbi:response regulator transcription factor [Neobacillus cucumis]|uniref:DNA-binding response regulator n=1 Tax=Neobacillus cucumis TaxID=1740721 RepID=A0A2N5HTR8_9BACI|nr:response regulator [Neobacillus cucumis]PLS08902.1 DNA-binding response regulator [Neobacillus cucumis]
MKESLRVLIADDEPIIREGIREAVNWQALGMTVVAEAEDGEEALELALQHSINILLVDLNMPIMNGISVIKHVRSQLPKCKIVIITGYDEFNYAQEALRLNVSDYILKPANPVQLQTLLEKVRNDLKADLKQEEFVKLASTQINKNIGLLREQLFYDLLDGKSSEEEAFEQLQFLGLPIKSPKQIGVIQSPEYYANKLVVTGDDNQLISIALEKLILGELEHFEKIFIRDYSGCMLILLWDSINEEKMMRIGKRAKEELKITIHSCFEPLKKDISSIPVAYQACKQIIEQDSSISPVVRRARDYIFEHFFEPSITLEKAAESLQVSPVYLSRIFKQELGISFVSLVTNLRVKKAISLLNSTDFSILEIAEKVGYDTQHYFSTAFKKVMGVSPNQYRKTPI